MTRIDRTRARREIVATLAADAACDVAAFDGDAITVVEYQERPGRRRFAAPAKPFQAFTTGHGLVVSCHRDWLAWSRERAETLDRTRFFAPANIAALVALLADAGQELVGPFPSYGCSADTLRPAAPPPGIVLDVATGPAIEALRSVDALRHALATQPNPARPDVLVVTARAGGELVGCASASADGDQLWQVGVDVLAPWRGRGVGRALVSRLTGAILDAGKVPYYSHTVSNLPSAALALSLGYWPSWVQVYALERR